MVQSHVAAASALFRHFYGLFHIGHESLALVYEQVSQEGRRYCWTVES